MADKRGRNAPPRRGEPKLGDGRRPGGGGRPPQRRAPAPRTQPPRRGGGKWKLIGSLFFTFVILALLGLGYFALDLPSLDKLDTFEKSPGIRIYDRDNDLAATYGHVVGEYIPFKQLPRPLVAAAIATEDRRFFHHWGVDPLGLLRAIWVNMREGDVVQGGSTITQQLAKNVFLTPDRTLKRKIQEAMLALYLENRFSKQKIMELYLNRVYLGGGNYGVDAAAHHYFDKSARQLNLQESALLVGLLKAPSRYTPTRDKELALQRTKQVLMNMQNAGLLDDTDTELAINDFKTSLKLKKIDASSTRYFTDWIVDQIPQYVGRVDGDLEVFTTIDLDLQQMGETAVTTVMKDAAKRNVSQAALLAMDNDGAIRVMIGGVNYGESQFNRAAQAKRQPGSSFKLFVYLAALQAGYRPDSIVVDQPITIGDWSPKNYTNEYRGEMPLREALALSINTVAAQLIRYTGAGRVIAMAKKLGITSPLNKDLSLALGTSDVSMLEMVTAFAHMPNEGRKVTPYAITKIVGNQNDETLYQREADTDHPQMIDAPIANMMNQMLSGVIAYGTGTAANIGRPAAGKTGTSNDFRDAWFLGFTGQMTAGAWVGNDNNTPMKKVTGGSFPARIWQQFMQAAHKGKPVVDLPTTGGTAAADESWGSWIDRLTSGDAPPAPTGMQGRGADSAGDRMLQNNQPNGGVFDWYDNRQNAQPVNPQTGRRAVNPPSHYQRPPEGNVIYEYPGDRRR